MSARSRVAAAALAALAVAGACGGSGGGSGGSDTAQTTKTFRSSVYGYTITHPAGWSVVEATHVLDDGQPPATGQGGTDILGVGADPKVSTMTLPALVIGGQKVSASTDIKGWTTSVISTVSFMKSCPQPDAREDLTVGQEPAVLLRYDDCPRGSGLFHYWVAVVHKGTGYHLVWFNQKASEATDRAALDKVLTSLTFST